MFPWVPVDKENIPHQCRKKKIPQDKTAHTFFNVNFPVYGHLQILPTLFVRILDQVSSDDTKASFFCSVSSRSCSLFKRCFRASRPPNLTTMRSISRPILKKRANTSDFESPGCTLHSHTISHPDRDGKLKYVEWKKISARCLQFTCWSRSIISRFGCSKSS